MAKIISTNNVSLSGRIVADATTNEAKNFARFAIAHNMGTDNVVFIDLVMFAKNHSKEVVIPFDLLKKGAKVLVNGYFSPKEKGFEFIVKSVKPLENSDSTNGITLSGRIVADATTNEAKNFARFAIAHNMGKDRVVFLDFTMFAKNHNRDVVIPFDLLKKGTPVKVDAYFSPKEKGYEFFVKNVELASEQEADANDENETTTEQE